MFKELFTGFGGDIDETFDNPYKINVHDVGEYSFTTDTGNGIGVDLDGIGEDPKDEEGVEIMFSNDGAYDMTGDGDAFRILATVIKIVMSKKKKLKKFDPVWFTAKSSESGKVKLYRVFARKLQKILKKKNVYELPMSTRGNKETAFYITNNDNKSLFKSF